MYKPIKWFQRKQDNKFLNFICYILIINIVLIITLMTIATFYIGASSEKRGTEYYEEMRMGDYFSDYPFYEIEKDENINIYLEKSRNKDYIIYSKDYFTFQCGDGYITKAKISSESSFVYSVESSSEMCGSTFTVKVNDIEYKYEEIKTYNYKEVIFETRDISNIIKVLIISLASLNIIFIILYARTRIKKDENIGYE